MSAFFILNTFFLYNLSAIATSFFTKIPIVVKICKIKETSFVILTCALIQKIKRQWQVPLMPSDGRLATEIAIFFAHLQRRLRYPVFNP